MSRESYTLNGPADLYRVLANHPRRLLVPIVVTTALAVVYAIMRPDRWEASQALIVRNEATTADARPGEFRHLDQLRTAQETILQIARNRSVLAAALSEAGPAAASQPSADWPSPENVSALRGAVKVTPPDGVEFGTTEVFYLKVKDKDQQRAIALASAVSNQLMARLRQLRDEKAQSMINELENGVKLAEADLNRTTARLSKLEAQVGGDLAELRILHEASSGEGDLRRKTIEIENELRQAREELHASEEMLNLLHDSTVDPGRLLAAPNRLLQSQPSLRQLKEGLITAQLNTAALRGRMTDEHPQVQAAIDAEQEVSEQLHDELAIAIRAAELDLRLNYDHVARLEAHVEDSNQRLETLASLRAEYSKLVAETTHRTLTLDEARQSLNEARASQAGAQGASVVAVIDAPDVGTGPIGPGKAAIALFGLVGGVVLGLGISLLTIPVSLHGTDALAEESPSHEERQPAVRLRAEHTASLSLKEALRRKASPAWFGTDA